MHIDAFSRLVSDLDFLGKTFIGIIHLVPPVLSSPLLYRLISTQTLTCTHTCHCSKSLQYGSSYNMLCLHREILSFCIFHRDRPGLKVTVGTA